MYRRIRRSSAVNGAVLRTRAQFRWGPQREVLSLRLELKDALDSGQAAIDLAAQGRAPRGELPRLFKRIRSEALAVDSRLRLMESETDSAVLAAELPEARLHVKQVSGMVRRVRSAVASGLGVMTDDVLISLRADVERELAALDAGLQELHSLNRQDEHFDASVSTSTPRLDRSR